MDIILKNSGIIFKKEAAAQELSWIIPTSGSQVFKSPINFPKYGKVEIKVMDTPQQESAPIFGYRSFVGADRISIDKSIVSNISKVYCYLNTNASALHYIPFGAEVKVLGLSRSSFYVDGVVVKTSTITEGYSENVEFGMAGLIYKNSSTSYQNKINTSVKYGAFMMWSDKDNEESLIVDAVPVKKGDGTICYYDKISKAYIYSDDGTNPNYEV